MTWDVFDHVFNFLAYVSFVVNRKHRRNELSIWNEMKTKQLAKSSNGIISNCWWSVLIFRVIKFTSSSFGMALISRAVRSFAKKVKSVVYRCTTLVMESNWKCCFVFRKTMRPVV